jgi:hypothetical protein
MPCSPLKANRRFGGTYQLQLQGRISRARYQYESDGANMFLHLQGREYYNFAFVAANQLHETEFCVKS